MSDFNNIRDLLKHKEETAKRDRVLWFESLRDCIEDGQIEDALKAIDAAIKEAKRNAA